MSLTDLEYKALLELYHNYNDAFNYLPNYIKVMFWERLYKPYS